MKKSFRLQQTFKIITSKYEPNDAKSSNKKSPQVNSNSYKEENKQTNKILKICEWEKERNITKKSKTLKKNKEKIRKVKKKGKMWYW